MNYTTIEQSKKLLELGLSPESADMVFPAGQEYPVIKRGNEFFNETKFNIFSLYYPCWSVGKLIGLLPDRIVHNELNCECFMTPHSVGYSSTFSNEKGFFNIVWHENPNFVDALFNAIVWLLENNYIG